MMEYWKLDIVIGAAEACLDALRWFDHQRCSVWLCPEANKKRGLTGGMELYRNLVGS